MCVQAFSYIGQLIRPCALSREHWIDIYHHTRREETRSIKTRKISSLATFFCAVTFPKPENRISNPCTSHGPRPIQALPGIPSIRLAKSSPFLPFSPPTVSLAESPSQLTIKPNHTRSSPYPLSARSSVIYPHFPFLTLTP